MADENLQEFFVERVANVAHANGVFRITLGVNEDANNVRPSVRLIIPGNQLGGLLQGIANAARNIGEQVQANLGDEGKDTAPVQPKKAKAPAVQAGSSSAGKKGSAKPAPKSQRAKAKKKKYSPLITYTHLPDERKEIA